MCVGSYSDLVTQMTGQLQEEEVVEIEEVGYCTQALL